MHNQALSSFFANVSRATLSSTITRRRPTQWGQALLVVAALSTALVGATAHAQTGVSDDRVSLPDGPGSLDGVGDNIQVGGNMGLMSNSLPISLPAGVNGMTPSLSLGYSSGGGNSTFGMGWSMSFPSIERMTSKGLPEYISDDLFVADGSNELVRISDAEPAEYRARYEGNFIRYQWHSRGTGDEGYWTADYPGGSTSYFGADMDGNLVETARVRSPDGVFRYLVVDSVDIYGNHINYDYRYYGSVPLIDTISWVFRDDGTPRYSAQFDYEGREDPIADARGGFNERTAHRVTDIRINSEGTQIRRYSFTYEDYATSGGVSRLSVAERFGRDGGLYGVRNTFTYSRALEGVCTTDDCDGPILVDAGSIGAGFGTGKVNLIDLNGDSLPDAVLTPDTGPHQIYLAQMDPVTSAVSFAAPFDSAVGDSGTFEMSSPYTQVLDVDGDGFTDLLNSLSGRWLRNLGNGDWDSENTITGGENLPDFSEDFELDGENELTHIRFTDIDGDRKIDVLRSDSVGTSLFRNLGDAGFVSIPVDPLDAAFSEDSTDLADVNGDGLLDPIQLREGNMRYRLSLGRGKWTAWTEMAGQPFDLEELEFVEVEDLNGDGLDDLVLVQGSSVRFALNRNTATFTAEQTVDSAGGQPLPNVDDTVTVLYADMNGNGSNDVIWVDDNGNVTFLDLFPTRPHLLSRVENGVGYTADITYGSMARERARDGGQGWDYPVPMATLVVTSMDVYALADDPSFIEHEVVEYEYAGGYYDGVEKAFRGFEKTFETLLDDEDVFTAETTFDVGIGDDRGNFAGIELEQILRVDGVSIQEFSSTWERCPLTNLPVTTPPIQFACEVASESIMKEGAPEAEWATLREEMEYDNYGNVVRTVEHGVVAIGGTGCAPCDRAAGETGKPCGPQCLGDESYSEVDYIPPENVTETYATSLVQERRSYSVEGGPVQRRRYFFDGDAFVGLPAGQATRGALTRASREVTEGVFIDVERNRLDRFGHSIETLRAGGDIDSAHRTEYFYSADGRDLIRVEDNVQSRGESVVLVMDLEYEPDFGKVSAASGWYVDGVDDPASKRKLWAHDEHGRLSALVEPGNSLSSPSEVYSYELGSPFSRIITEKRSTIGGPLDMKSVSCVDGFSREIQTRSRVSDGEYLVSGYSVYDRAGNPVRLYDAYTASDDNCSRPPDEVLFTEIEYDGLGREVRTIHPDGIERGTASERRKVFLPLGVQTYNEDDNDPDAEGFNTPTTILRDGQSRTVSIERPLPEGGIEKYEMLYDGLGRLSGYLAPDGTVKTQRYNLMDRVVEVNDPDAGTWTYEYSEAGELLRSVDGRGIAIERSYDSRGRKIEEWVADDRDATLAEFFYDLHPDCPTDSCTFGAGQTVGMRTQTADGPVVQAYGFDQNGEPVHESRLFRGAVLRTDRTLDNASRVVSESFTGGHVINYTVDPISRPTAIEGVVDSITYTDDGQVSQWEAANGSVTTFTFNARKHVVGLQSGVAAAGDVMDLQLTRDRNANVTSVVDSTAEGSLSSSATFDINSLTQLVAAEFDDETITFSHDTLYRTTSKVSSLGDASPAHVGDLAYTGSNPRGVTDAGGVPFTYDAGGFVTERGDDTLTFDHHGRLTAVERAGTNILNVSRDAVGGRVLAKIANEERQYFGVRLEVRDGISRVKVRVGDDVVAVLESASDAGALLAVDGTDGAVTAADAFSAASGAQPTLLRSAARRLLLDVAGEATYVHQDHLGSTVALTSESGEVRERFSYYPYGAVRATSAMETEWASYTGVDHDVTGYLDYRNRVLSPREGRWLSVDPVFINLEATAIETPAEAFASYSFVANNPTTTIDIDGYIKWGKVAKVAASVVATVAAAAAVVAVTIAGAGVVNTVGAIVGGVVTAATEVAVMRAQLKQKGTSFSQLSGKQKLKAVGGILFKTTLGAASGFATGGLSAIGTVIGGGADLAETHPSAGRKTKIAANVARVVAIGVNLTVGLTNPVGAMPDGGLAGALGASESVQTAAEAGSTVVEVTADAAGAFANDGSGPTDSQVSAQKKNAAKKKARKARAKRLKKMKKRMKKTQKKNAKAAKKAAKAQAKADKAASK